MTASAYLPSNVSGGRQHYADGEPFRVKARPRIGIYLAEPICAKGLNGACQENDTETRDEQNYSLHRKRCLIWTNSIIAAISFALAPEAQRLRC